MKNDRDNQISEDELLAAYSIKLQESEPLSSSAYVHIALEGDDSSASRGRPSAPKKRTSKSDSQRPKQKKQRTERVERPPARKPSPNDPALHVIIERAPQEEEYEEDYDYYEPEVRLPQDLTAQYSRSQGSGGSSQLEQFAAQFPAIPDGLMYQVDEPEPSAPSSAVLPQSAAWQESQPQSQSQQPFGYSAYQGEPVSYELEPQQQVQEQSAAPLFSQTPSARIEPLGSHTSGQAVQSVPELSHSQESVIRADGSREIIRRPWNSSGDQKPAQSAQGAQPAQQSQPSVSDFAQPSMSAEPARPTIPSEVVPFVQPMAGSSSARTKRGMNSWKRNALGGPAAGGVPYSEAPSAQQAPTIEIPFSSQPQQSYGRSDASSAQSSDGQLAIKIGSHGRISGSDHLTISRDSLKKVEPSHKKFSNVSDKHPSPAASKGEGSADKKDKTASIDDLGAPILDETALEESTMFEEPPVSIADGMKEADGSRKRHRKGIIIALIFIVLAAALGIVGYLQWSGAINMFPSSSSSARQASTSASTSASVSSSSASTSASSSATAASRKDDLSGTVVYQYTASTSDDVNYDVTETTTFDSAGKCVSTEMQLKFPSEEELDYFIENLKRDYGSNFTLNSQDGANATITINISDLKLDREAYEDALRYSVEDLVILKK